MKKWIILIILICFCIGAYLYIYKDHRNIETEAPVFVVTANSIGSEFSKGSLKSEKKYLNKTIIVSGIISEINQNDLTINDKIFCQFSKILKQSLKIGSEIKIKGRVIGYDDLLEQIKLDQCIIE
ncbi:hypothetical protein Q4Q34_13335 [Flavivirga abyssicola]|uniref:OB-fold protein n=1 Tax=Flavivirga abyssicola TaxID=3063533 RepID=UPI0026DEB141|nr:hypothetical protein [Flavivirga sp. MEBiC07777]WVK12203.1 hypothetical protein Q4Q34_13335 [Flavivirga sp. MEBiC07777]